jgi:RNA polymerase primary sigma factor
VVEAADSARTDGRGTAHGLTACQRDTYERIPEDIKHVWHPSFDDPAAKERFFGAEAREIDTPGWTLSREVPDEAGKAPRRRKVLSKADEAQLFLRYNYARFRLSKLAERQRRRPSRARATAMLAWHDRTQKLRSDLVGANMSLVVAMAKRTRIPNVDYPELISEGSMALLRAVDKFDVSRGYKFSTYACRAILKGFNRMASKAGRYYNRFGVPYDPEMERSDYDEHKHEMRQAGAVDDLREVIAENRAELTAVERTIVVERFGLGGHGRGRTLAEVGKMVGLTNERVRQIQKTALRKIREVLNEQYLAA